MILAALALVQFFERVVHQEQPFAAATRLAERLGAKASDGGDWRRFEGEDFVVELGPYFGRTPQKIVIVKRAANPELAAAYVQQIFAALPAVPDPRPSLEVTSYRGTLVIGRRPVGLEVGRVDATVTVTLVAGGPRILVPL
ncbi:MAG: hypothetical protein JOZ54_01545 [Acidobacteria bacterium]|nr:hypothetical protein [Acidobacteriota bacterium]